MDDEIEDGDNVEEDYYAFLNISRAVSTIIYLVRLNNIK